MCTAISFKAGDHYFGRNLDYDRTFGECVTITPRRYPFGFSDNHYAMIGMALPSDGYPLYFDATNEKGLSMAGLNFPKNAVYTESGVPSYELIPWLLGSCETVEESVKMLDTVTVSSKPFGTDLPPTPLHWLLSDSEKSVTVEQTNDGLRIFENPTGVLTNNPTFDKQIFNLNNYMSLSVENPQNNFSSETELSAYSLGMGAMGLPGDLSSMSRFVRASFVKLNSVCEIREHEAVNQFFHILYSVQQPRGCTKTDSGYEITNYSSCCNTNKGIYYYTTYENFCISAADMYSVNLDSDKIITYTLPDKPHITKIN